MKRIIHAAVAALCATVFTSASSLAADKPNYWERSVQAEENGNLEQALKEIYTYATEGGDRYLSAIRAAWICYQKQDYPLAAKYYEAASQAAPAAINPKLGAAAVAYRLRDWPNVQKAAEAVTKLDPANYQAGLYLGEAAFQTRHYVDAIRLLTQMQGRYPEDTSVLSWLGWSYLYKGDLREARIAFSKVLLLDSDYPLASQGLAAASK